MGTANIMAQGGPTMGWSSWNTYGVNISDTLIRRQADAMISKGLSAVGYDHINIATASLAGAIRRRASSSFIPNVSPTA